jgi:hypothetical protein
MGLLEEARAWTQLGCAAYAEARIIILTIATTKRQRNMPAGFASDAKKGVTPKSSALLNSALNAARLGIQLAAASRWHFYQNSNGIALLGMSTGSNSKERTKTIVGERINKEGTTRKCHKSRLLLRPLLRKFMKVQSESE